MNTIYNFNIRTCQIEQNGEIIDGFKYDCLIVPFPLTSNNILSTLLSELFPEDYEQKLQNDFNAATLLIEPETKKQAYIDFLIQRKLLREMVDTDYLTANLSN